MCCWYLVDQLPGLWALQSPVLLKLLLFIFFRTDWQLLSSNLKLTAWLKFDPLKDRSTDVPLCVRSRGLAEEHSHPTAASVSQRLGQLYHWEPKSGHSNTKNMWIFWEILRKSFLSYSESEILKIVYLDPWLCGGIASGKRNGGSVQSHLWRDLLWEMFANGGALLSKRANVTSFLQQQLFEMLSFLCPKKGGN